MTLQLTTVIVMAKMKLMRLSNLCVHMGEAATERTLHTLQSIHTH